MNVGTLYCRLCAVVLLAAAVSPVQAQRQMEKLGRGVLVLHSATSQAYVSWRLLANDPSDIGFNVYRSANGAAAVKLNSFPITNTTDYLDTTASFTVTNFWYVTPTNLTTHVAGTPSAPWGLAANSAVRQYFSIPLQPVAGGAHPPYDTKFCWVGDFDGDGEYDFLVDRLSTTGGVNQYLQAYKRDGTLLWQMDMGFNSTNTSNAYEPDAAAICVGDKDNVTVYDLDGDGKAEVVVRTANGTTCTNAAGVAMFSVTTNNNVTQFLSIVDGLTGAEKARAVIPNPYFADGPLNCHAGIVYLDGVHPSILFSGENRVGSGSFQRLAVAWDYRNGQLTQRWLYQTPNGQNDSEAHQLRIADAKHDGKDAIIRIGGVISDSNGVPVTLYSTECVHGDRYHVTDIDPDRPGLEMYSIQQLNQSLLATSLQDLGSGVLFKKWYSGSITDVGRGLVADMNPNYRGSEIFSTQPGIFDAKGIQISTVRPWPWEGIWWNTDMQREFFAARDGNGQRPCINRWNYAASTEDLVYNVQTEGVHSAYGARPTFFGDILGDWREEFIVVADDYSALRIYATANPATNRLYCLMQNPQYRVQCTFKGYYQASYPDYFLGEQMQPPQPPPQTDTLLVWRGTAGNTWDNSTANWRTNWTVIGNANTNPAIFASTNTVLFDLTGSNNTAIALTGTLTPGDVTVYSPKDYTFDNTAGSLSGTMKLIKAGAGKLTLTGTNDFSGNTTIWEGPLLVNGKLSSSPVTVRGGIWLDGAIAGNGLVQQGATVYRGGSVSPGNGNNFPGTLTISNGLTLVDGAFCRFDLSDDATGAIKTNDLLNITGNLTLTGNNHIVINRINTSLSAGTVYPLINYSGSLVGSLANFDITGITGIPVALTNPPGQIALVVKSYRAPTIITWTGGQGGNTWDLLTSSNWLNAAAKDQFAPGDTVRFDNTGATNLTTTLTGDLTCAGILVDSSANYTLAGSGAIIGTASLLKTNSGTLIITAINNTFTGKTTLAGGTLAISKLDAVGYPSPLGNPPGGSTNLILSGSPTLRILGESYTDRGITLNAGTNTIEVANAADQVTVAGLITGGGALQKLGAGTLALNVSNNFTGGVIIKAGNLSLGGGNANQYALGTGLITLDNGTLTMFSDSGTYDTCYWNLTVPTNSTGTIYADDRVNLYGFLTGGGTLNFNVYYVRTELDGNWSAFTGQLNIGTDANGGDFRIGTTAGYANASVNLADHIYAYHVSGSGVSLGAVSGGALSTMSGTPWTVGAKNTDATYAGTITGNSVTKVGIGTWTLTGNNTYTGNTTVSTGTLVIHGNQSAASGVVTIAAAGTLGGSGIIGGATTLNGWLSPGPNFANLTVSNNLTLTAGSSTYLELSKSPKTNDLITVSGTLTLGGTLQVTNLGGTLTAGDSFKIFAAVGNGATSFATYNLPPLGAGLSWDVSALRTNGTLTIVSTGGLRSLTWKGDGAINAWDINTTLNWLDTNNFAAYFLNNENVTFNDSGSNNLPILLTPAPQPGSTTVNATKDYIFSGGNITGTNSLTKSGSGMLSLANSNSYTGDTVINAGTVRALAVGNGLANRWSFNNSLADSIGGSPAAIVDVGANNVTLGDTNITLTGGTSATSDFISLGANLLPNTTSPVTIELWATQNAIQNWARVFDFGTATTEYLTMSWTTATTLTTDLVEWKDTVTSTVFNSCQPYTLGVEFHIAMVIEPSAGVNGNTRVTWYRASATNSTLGVARGTFSSTNTLATFVATNLWLGHSEFTGDNTASASYNEVRLWQRALTTNQLQTLHTAGPNAIIETLNLATGGGALSTASAVNLAGATGKLENSSGQTQTIGSLAGVTGSEVKLTSGSLVAGGNNTSTAFAGFLSGTNNFTKSGTGTLTLSGTNIHTGATTVSGGTLLVNGNNSAASGAVSIASGATLGGTGILGGVATVQYGGTLSPGAGIGTLTFASTLTLATGCTNFFEISKAAMINDVVNISGALTSGGLLVVTNITTNALVAGDTFKLYNAGSYGGAFGSVSLPTLDDGLVWNTNALNTSSRITVSYLAAPRFGSASLVGSSLVFISQGGTPGMSCYVLSSTNLLLPIANWTRQATNVFDSSGGFAYTNDINQNQQSQFYRLLVP